MPIPPTLQTREVEQLGSDGYFIRTDWLSADHSRGARAAVQALQHFHPASMGRGADRQQQAALRGDERTWVDRAGAPDALEPLLLAFDTMKNELNREAYLGLERLELQGARYLQSGARYARHRDSFQGRAGRRVTFIYYLNDAWLPEHGGCLRLHVLPAAIDVPPRLNSLVVFLSEQVEHEVLSSFADRWALTAWWSGPGA